MGGRARQQPGADGLTTTKRWRWALGGQMASQMPNADDDKAKPRSMLLLAAWRRRTANGTMVRNDGGDKLMLMATISGRQGDGAMQGG